MNIKAKLASLAAVAIIVGTQYPIASNADQPVLQAGDYIVVFDNQANEQAEAAKLRGQGATVNFVYDSVFKGLAGTFNAAQINALQKNPRVKLIEKDSVVTADSEQSSPTWGLDRIDEAALPLDSKYVYNTEASNVYAYVIDTGIAKHSEFGSRLQSFGFSAFKDKYGFYDCAGHGTHVAGTIGGSTYGVAKAVNLVAVRVLNCQGSGTNSGVIAGINYVIAHHNKTGNLAVANMSLGGGYSQSLNDSVAALFDNGITISVAAGNSNVDAINSSPSSEPKAITVGASTITDTRASFSNFGSIVDLFAPGLNITSANYRGGSALMSGTSMAAPHVTGVAALYLGAHISASPSDVASAIISNATSGKLTGIGTGSPNALLYSLIS